MRFLWVVLSVALIVGGIPLPVAAEDAPVGVTELPTIDQAEPEQLDDDQSEAADDKAENADQSVVAPAATIVSEAVADDPAPVTLLSPIITEIQTAGTDEFVELYNPNNEQLPLTGLSLWYRGSGVATTQLVDLGAVVLQPKQFVVFGHIAVATTSPVIAFAKQSYSLNDTVGEVVLGKTAASNDVLDKVAWGSATAVDGYVFDIKPAVAPLKNNSLQRCFIDGGVAIASPRDTSKEFTIYSNDLPTPFIGIACIVPDPPKPVNNCEGLHINEIAANVTDQFIELQNDTDHTIALDGCRLQTNRSQTKVYVFGAEVLAAGELRTVMIHDTELTLTKTTSGIVYVVSSDGQTEADMQVYSNLAAGTSWSRTPNKTWEQTYTVTPGQTNIMQKYVPCDDGYVRNDMTGRCNKLAPMNAPIDCGEGKYRSEESGRCRTIPVASVLAACKLGQYRSEETNRCRNIVAASVQKPCKDNQYRSEETNRCRNLPASAVPESSFAVQPVKEGVMAFVGWWVLGGVGVLAAGYGAWEWRYEIRKLIGKVVSHFSAWR